MTTPSTFYEVGTKAASWVSQVWAKTYERAPYFRGVLLSRSTEYEPLHGEFHLPQIGTFTPAAVANGTDLTQDGLVFSANTEGEFTVTPGTVMLNTAVNDNVLWRAASDPRSPLKDSFEMALTQKIDQDGFAKFNSAVLGAAGDYANPLDKSVILNCQARIESNAKEYADEGGEIFFAFHPNNSPAVRSTSDFVSAYVRGDGENPAVSGRVINAFGISFVPSGNVRTNGGGTGYDNAMWIRKGLGYSFNKRPTVEVQRRGFGWWLISGCEYGWGVVRDAYIGTCRSSIPTL